MIDTVTGQKSAERYNQHQNTMMNIITSSQAKLEKVQKVPRHPSLYRRDLPCSCHHHSSYSGVINFIIISMIITISMSSIYNHHGYQDYCSNTRDVCKVTKHQRTFMAFHDHPNHNLSEIICRSSGSGQP